MNKKLRVPFWSILWRFLIVFALVILVAFFGFVGLYITYDVENGMISLVPWEAKQIIITSLILVAAIALLIFSYLGYYYVVEKDHFICVRLGRVIQYDYKNIIFIDVDKSKSQSVITFYSTRAKMQYLIKDKDGILLDSMVKRCQNLVSLEEFRRIHPEEKY